MKSCTLSFSEIEIQKLFGHEAAEDEDPDRLREYYFKSSVFDQVVADLPLRIVVGHKGVGKSALFQVAMKEDIEEQKIVVFIKPDDIVGLGTKSNEFLQLIREWKEGLSEIIARKILNSLGVGSDDMQSKIKKNGGIILDVLNDSFDENTMISLNPAKRLIINKFIKSKIINVYIDDLDRGWQGRPEDVTRISALLNAIRDISAENRGIHFKVSLRSDVYFLVRTSDESTDKIEGSVIWHSWDNFQIMVLLAKRIETFFGRELSEEDLIDKNDQKEVSKYLDAVFTSKFEGQGLWQNAPIYRVLVSLIRKRPRDLVKICTLAARDARDNGTSIIGTSNLKNIFDQYSQGRLQDTINEYRSELPEIERLIVNMKPNKKERTAKAGYVYNTADLLRKINNIMQMGEFRFQDGKKALNKDLAAFMYKINFLTARKETDKGIVRKYFEENRYLSNSFIDFGFDWEIHPAYRWALQPDNIMDIYNGLALNE